MNGKQQWFQTHSRSHLIEFRGFLRGHFCFFKLLTVYCAENPAPFLVKARQARVRAAPLTAHYRGIEFCDGNAGNLVAWAENVSQIVSRERSARGRTDIDEQAREAVGIDGKRPLN